MDGFRRPRSGCRSLYADMDPVDRPEGESRAPESAWESHWLVPAAEGLAFWGRLGRGSNKATHEHTCGLGQVGSAELLRLRRALLHLEMR